MWHSASVCVTCFLLWSVGFPTPRSRSGVDVDAATWPVDVGQESASNVSDDQRQRVSRYMLELYTRYSQSQGSGESQSRADVIRSFTPRKLGSLIPIYDSYLGSEREIRHLLEFDISGTRKGESLNDAELRLFTIGGRNRRNHWAARVLYVSTLDDADDRQRGVVHQSSGQDAWMTFNVTSALSRRRDALKRRAATLRFVMHVTGVDVDLEGEIQPLLLLSYSTNKPQPPEKSSRGRRSAEAEDYEEESNNVWDDDLMTSPRTTSGNSAARRARRLRNTCRRRPLYVDFSEIHYDTWIVAPSGYEAFQCLGKCFFPVSEHLSPTKHAIVQTLIHSVAPGKVSRACCVPTRLEPISVLYVDQRGVLTYRFNYQDMVVAECGCR